MPRTALPFLLAAALAGCGGGEAPAESGTAIWETPDLPWPWTMEVAGEPVPEDVLRPYLESEWADFANAVALRPENALAALDDFCADPEARFGPLVGDVLLLREGERRFPVLDLAEYEDYLAEMTAATGAAVEALRRKLGEDGLRRFVERRLRLEKTMDALAGETAEPSAEELAAAYQEKIAALESAPGAPPPTFEELAPRLRAEWRRERWYEAGRAWIERARQGVEARVTRPDGRILVVPAP
ncbi:MAG: hypothetical protein D6702_02255 [Planctomycetota bacterium]|nr:MAG: hypothetical protein D6702_02255 [Planctomycetota bacterium]